MLRGSRNYKADIVLFLAVRVDLMMVGFACCAETKIPVERRAVLLDCMRNVRRQSLDAALYWFRLAEQTDNQPNQAHAHSKDTRTDHAG
jgi:hypothetical protein